MTSAAIYWNPEAYDTSGKALMGRHSAGEGFTRGYFRYGTGEELALWNVVGRPTDTLEPLVRKLGCERPIRWIARGDFGALSQAGVINLPIPGLGEHAWARQLGDQRSYSLQGVTHTTVTGRVLDALAELVISPVQPWDALVCTSRAVVASLNVMNEAQDEYLRSRLGAARLPRPQYVHIPLGISTEDFIVTQEKRTSWREKLQIARDDIVVLYVGRFNLTSKMNPVAMAQALERVARRTSHRLHWVLAGWANEDHEKVFKEAVKSFCDKVTVHFVDGRPVENRFSIWSIGDLFLSLCDNLQETFGLTPVEAMAAGLPAIVSDWDGYKDTVRHGIDGFRIPTFTPAAGLGRDLAFSYARNWSTYDGYVGSASQFTAIDLDAAAHAILQLVDNASLRNTMGQNAQRHARATFDWKHIIPQYEALWKELGLRRRAAAPEPPSIRNTSDNPWRLDPFRMFASYPTEWATLTTMLSAADEMDWPTAEALMAKPMVRAAASLLPHVDEVRQIIEMLAERQMTVADLLARFPPGRRPFLERGVVWMAKYGLLRILGRSNHIP